MKKLLGILLIILLQTNYSFAEKDTFSISCEGVMKTERFHQKYGSEITETRFYEDLKVFVNHKEKNIYLVELEDTSHGMLRDTIYSKKRNNLQIIGDGTTLILSPKDYKKNYDKKIRYRYNTKGRLSFINSTYVGKSDSELHNEFGKTTYYYNWDSICSGTNQLINFIKNDQTENSDNSQQAGSSGTAFFINKEGYLLTNNHVIDGCSLSNITYKNKDYESKIIAKDKNLDLALLKAEINPNLFFSFSKDAPKKLSKIYVAGYPFGKGLSDDLKISSGIISSLKGLNDNSNEIQIDAPINPGNSGGPIINENGDLIAIAVSGLAKDQTEGINFGIKSSSAENFLNSNQINPKISLHSGIKDNDELLRILEEGTVYTYCNN